MPHPVLSPAKIAVVTGGASGIGLAAGRRFAEFGMKVCIADIGKEKLETAKRSLMEAAPGDADAVMVAECDVGDIEQVAKLERKVREQFGAVHVLMNNAGIQPGSTMFGSTDKWQRILQVNLWGIIYGTQVFVPNMIAKAARASSSIPDRSRVSRRRPVIRPIMCLRPA